MSLRTEKFREQEYSGATKTIMDIADLQRRMAAILSHADMFLPYASQELSKSKQIIDKLVEELYGKSTPA